MGLDLEDLPYDDLLDALETVNEEMLIKVLERLGYEPIKEAFKSPVYQCPDCLDIFYSRWSGDFRGCSCGACFVDTTSSYVRTNSKGILLGTMEVKQ